MKFDWFLKGMIAAVVLAFVFPEPGSQGGFLHPEVLNKLGIALVFYLNGLSLSMASLRQGVSRWRVHVLIQTSTFLVFPLLGLGLMQVGQRWISPDVLLGYFYLCALPSTVSSSVALTVAARGNVPVALFNATLSALMGVVLTPLWMAWVMGHEGQPLDVWPVVVDLLMWVVLPLIVGQLSRPWLNQWAARHKGQIQVVDRLTILTLVYTSFSDSVQQGIWHQYGAGVLIQTLVVSCVLFFLIYQFMQFSARLMHLSEEDRIAAVLCGSKKTLASGVPMAHLIFGANPALGLILIPIMLYHPLQLAVGGLLSQRWASRR
ncbi:bile acid:sodium symporter family protein [Limnohabitans sp. INBF002]|jgi:sodium/bile acid cotransporter 7|uniref:bile acid:sodium symporter family protein n=1 Tax=Limnohabitans sp. INBF002 TaxID=2986280 RepID=UPI00237776F4|nr:bile acid:sodium symporter family protein [Limnohabitans sp. INBF002]BDU52413.1 transporter [Limnohabitans sp. INBF002]